MFRMPPKTCTVTMTDVRGSRHSVEILAESVFEAAALGLRLLRDDGWVDKPGPATRLEIQAKTPAVRYEVTVQQIQRWLEGSSISPNEMVRKAKLKAMIGQM